MDPAAGEPVRLVIWDLDDTFWRGTLSEGGIAELIPSNHELVAELARRGIMNSICSRNDFDEARQVLVGLGVWDLFVFPSIDWTAKPARVRAIVEAMQLRPQSVLFIDDNPSNRAAVVAELPGLRAAPETFVGEIAGHPAFRGKRDDDLSRLRHYKLLEKRSVDRVQAADPREFLRASGIRVQIELDLDPHYARVVELINRTNQLNFTKKRLSDDAPTAIAQLRRWLAEQRPWAQVGLVRVIDNYGDYGFCGFYALIGRRLEYFCFSCRVLGFGVETWVYALLGRPEIEIVGEVLVDVRSAPRVDWIAAEERGEAGPAPPAADPGMALRLRGRCEVGLLTPYFRHAGAALEIEGAFREGGLELFSDSAVNLYFSSGARWPHTRQELAQIGLGGYAGSKMFAPGGPPVVFFAHRDFFKRPLLYRHKRGDFVVCLGLVDFRGDLIECDFAEIVAHVRAREPDAERAEAEIAHLAELRRSYVSVSAAGEAVAPIVERCLRGLLDNSPSDALLMPVLMHPQARDTNGKVWEFAEILESRRTLTRALGGDRRVAFIDASACVRSPAEIVDWFHYDRVVYYRLANAALDLCRTQAPLVA